MKCFPLASCLILALAARCAAGEVTATPDLAYSDADPDKTRLDLFMPKGAKDCPVVLFVHGGNYRVGDRKGVKELGPALASEGVGVAVMSYRLLPKAKHPEQIGDVAQALAWLEANASKYGGSPNRLFLMGHGTGGHLATLLAADARYLSKVKLDQKDVKGVIGLEGEYVPINKAAFGADKGLTEASPAAHVSAKTPPMLLLYSDGSGEKAEGQAKALAKATRAANATADTEMVSKRSHRSLLLLLAADEPAGKAILAFVRRHSEK